LGWKREGASNATPTNPSDKMHATRSMESNSMNNKIDIQQLNRNLAEQINADALRDPHSPFAGKKVGIANGQVVVAADTWDEVGRRLRQAEPDATKRY